jgi:uncharacterized protein YlxP (DUF503 family)
MKVGLLTLSLQLHSVASLKERRSIVKRMLTEIRRLGPSFAACELSDSEDLHRLTIRIGHLSNDARYTDSSLARLQRRFERGNGYNIVDATIELL